MQKVSYTGTKIVTEPIARGAIAELLGENNGSVVKLCKSSHINIWSKCKPMNLDKPVYADHNVRRTAMMAKNWGMLSPGTVPYYKIKELYANKENPEMCGWGYDKPAGGADSSCRLGDFYNYYHDAKIPFGNFKVDDKNGSDNVWQRDGKIKFTLMINAVDERYNIVLGDLGIVDKYFGVIVETNNGEAGEGHLDWDVQDMYHVLCSKGEGLAVEREPVSKLTTVNPGEMVVFPDWFSKVNYGPDVTQVRFYPVTYEVNKEGKEVNFCTIPMLEPVTFRVEPEEYATIEFHAMVDIFRNVTITGSIKTNLEASISGRIYFEKKNANGAWENINKHACESDWHSIRVDDTKHKVVFGTSSESYMCSLSEDLPSILQTDLDKVRLVVVYEDPEGIKTQYFNLEIQNL